MSSYPLLYTVLRMAFPCSRYFRKCSLLSWDTGLKLPSGTPVGTVSLGFTTQSVSLWSGFTQFESCLVFLALLAIVHFQHALQGASAQGEAVRVSKDSTLV